VRVIVVPEWCFMAPASRQRIGTHPPQHSVQRPPFQQEEENFRDQTQRKLKWLTVAPVSIGLSDAP